MSCNLKTTKLLDSALIRVCAVTGLNMVSVVYFLFFVVVFFFQE